MVLKNKSISGAVLFQVLLALGLMVIMSPIIFSQIKKYNEQIKREEIVSQIDLLRKAVSSFIAFEKDNNGNNAKIKSGLMVKTNSNLFTLLSSYLNGLNIVESYGQNYSLVTNKDNFGNVEAALVLHGGTLSTESGEYELSAIAQYLYDNTIVISSDNQILSSSELSEKDLFSETLKKLIIDTQASNNTNIDFVSCGDGIQSSICPKGKIVILFTDSFFSSDYLFTDSMVNNGSKFSLVNTMLTTLYMNGHNLTNVYDVFANKIENTVSANLSSLNVSNLNLESGPNFNVSDSIEILNVNDPIVSSDGKFPVETKSMEVEEMTVQNDMNVGKILMENDGDLFVNRDLIVSETIVDGNVEFSPTKNDVYLSSITSDTAETVGSGGDIVKKIVFEEDGRLYINHTNGDHNIMLQLDKTSEVYDVVLKDGTSLSDFLFNLVGIIQDKVKSYYEANSN